MLCSITFGKNASSFTVNAKEQCQNKQTILLQRILPRWKILYSDSAFQWVETVTRQKLTKYSGGWQWLSNWVLIGWYHQLFFESDLDCPDTETTNINLYHVTKNVSLTCLLLFITSTKKMYSFTPISSIRICLAQFLSAYFPFWKREIFNLNLTIAVCRKHDSSSWFRF